MNLPPIDLPPLSKGDPLTPQTLPSAVRGWQVGQVLHATVVNRPTTQTATLRFGANEVPVRTGIPLATGAPVRVRVDTIGVTITLRLLGGTPGADTTRNDALRAALPRQQSFAPLLANLSRLIAPRNGASTTSAAPALPPSVFKLAQQLFDALPEARRLATPEGVRQAIRDSGTLAEARLAANVDRGTSPAMGDTKLNLVRLLDSLRALLRAPATMAEPASLKPLPLPLSIAPPLRDQPPVAQARVPPSIVQLLEDNVSQLRIVQELTAQLEGALARLQISQISSLPSEQNPTQIWVAEVPVRQGQQTDLFQFRIEHRRPAGAQAEEYWSITFAFELEELGAVRARVVFHQQELSATLWAERPATARKFKEHLDELRNRIEKHGLPVRSLECLAGIPDSNPPPSSAAGLIDEQA